MAKKSFIDLAHLLYSLYIHRQEFAYLQVMLWRIHAPFYLDFQGNVNEKLFFCLQILNW